MGFALPTKELALSVWVAISEAREKGGSHFRMAKKFSTTSRWRAIGKLLKSKYGIKLNFSDTPKNYYTVQRIRTS